MTAYFKAVFYALMFDKSQVFECFCVFDSLTWPEFFPLQAWWWVRPLLHLLPLQSTPLSFRTLPVWLQHPWFSAARPRAAPLLMFLLVSRARQDPSTTTVSQSILTFAWCHIYFIFQPTHFYQILYIHTFWRNRF